MSTTIELIVEGAGCQGCVDAIEGALNGAEGIESATFDLESNIATVVGDRSVADLVSIIDEAGYDAAEK